MAHPFAKQSASSASRRLKAVGGKGVSAGKAWGSSAMQVAGRKSYPSKNAGSQVPYFADGGSVAPRADRMARGGSAKGKKKGKSSTTNITIAIPPRDSGVDAAKMNPATAGAVPVPVPVPRPVPIPVGAGGPPAMPSPVPPLAPAGGPPLLRPPGMKRGGKVGLKKGGNVGGPLKAAVGMSVPHLATPGGVDPGSVMAGIVANRDTPPSMYATPGGVDPGAVMRGIVEQFALQQAQQQNPTPAPAATGGHYFNPATGVDAGQVMSDIVKNRAGAGVPAPTTLPIWAGGPGNGVQPKLAPTGPQPPPMAPAGAAGGLAARGALANRAALAQAALRDAATSRAGAAVAPRPVLASSFLPKPGVGGSTAVHTEPAHGVDPPAPAGGWGGAPSAQGLKRGGSIKQGGGGSAQFKEPGGYPVMKNAGGGGLGRLEKRKKAPR